jgi:hypothetical protein
MIFQVTAHGSFFDGQRGNRVLVHSPHMIRGPANRQAAALDTLRLTIAVVEYVLLKRRMLMQSGWFALQSPTSTLWCAGQ